MHRVNLVVMLMILVRQLVLENRVVLTTTAQLVNLVVMLMIHVQQLVLENRVPLIATAELENVVILMTHVKLETVM